MIKKTCFYTTWCWVYDVWMNYSIKPLLSNQQTFPFEQLSSEAQLKDGKKPLYQQWVEYLLVSPDLGCLGIDCSAKHCQSRLEMNSGLGLCRHKGTFPRLSGHTTFILLKLARPDFSCQGLSVYGGVIEGLEWHSPAFLLTFLFFLQEKSGKIWFTVSEQWNEGLVSILPGWCYCSWLKNVWPFCRK